MKVIAGIYKGRNIDTIKDTATRPMMGIAREGIINTLQISFENADVLDLFAGSGSMGIEALSRGAKYVTFIDNSPDCIKQINKNLQEYKNDYIDELISAVITQNIILAEKISRKIILTDPNNQEAKLLIMAQSFNTKNKKELEELIKNQLHDIDSTQYEDLDENIANHSNEGLKSPKRRSYKRIFFKYWNGKSSHLCIRSF